MTLFHGLGPFAASGIASGDFDFITSASGTGVAAINVDNCFSAAYDHYLVMRDLLGSAGDSECNIRLRVGGTDASGANYRHQRIYATATTVGGDRATGVTYSQWGFGFVEAASFGFARTFISNPFGAVRTTLWNDCSYDADGNIMLQSIVGEHDLTTSYDGLSVLPNSGTITGSIFVYGWSV